ncbi:hypothetical protein H310_12296 [Aphanomyces invadans]|uniref:WW domain-containing protein n=1 Tax=Aphanomyces invadans TaxID=157072 RepID=A0A024TIU7_9STRA|nr:hypothetical protein H310_12296 [Aphanomyces invadans]ETV93963.1 hypothetical protein H310_12296 [Aphanomyces invadans]|eukprot:XP_008877523.1 hypothetical protein H310_12296 [Aphanomyces invadans]
MTPPVPSVLAPPMHHPIELLDQLLGTLLLVLSLGFLVLLDLTRRRVLSLHQFTFCLASVVATLTIGAFIEHNIPNDVLDLALFGYYTQSSTVLQLRYAPFLTAAFATVAFLVVTSLCSCTCCCLCVAGPSKDAKSTADTSHQRCVLARLRHALSVYCLSIFALFLVLGMRLNARMRLSAIKPVGGTLHWQLLQTPVCVAALHIASLALVVLKDVLQHAEAPHGGPCQPLSRELRQLTSPPNDSAGIQPVHGAPTTPGKNSINHQTKQQGALAQSLRRLPSKSSTTRIRLESTDDDARSKSSSLVDTEPSSPPGFVERAASSPRYSKNSRVQRVSPVRRRAVTDGDSIPSPTRRRATPLTPRDASPASPVVEAAAPGDISNLISSESESDDDVIVPSVVRQFTSEYAMTNRLVAARSENRAMPRGSPSVGRSATEQGGNHPHHAPPTGSPWVLCYDAATSAPYYYCHDTGESAWEMPGGHDKWE